MANKGFDVVLRAAFDAGENRGSWAIYYADEDRPVEPSDPEPPTFEEWRARLAAGAP